MELTENAKRRRREESPLSAALGTARAALFAPARQFDPAHPELIDRAGTDADWLEHELLVMARANERYGVHSLLLRYLESFIPARPGRPVTLLDLGTGSADIPRAVASALRGRKQAVEITAVDRNPEVLRRAEKWSRDWPDIHVECHDLLALPYEPESFDVVMCSQALHHFSADDAVQVLRHAWDIAKVGCIINDLRRNWLSIGLVEAAARMVVKSPIIRHDAPQSCRAAFTVEELRRLAQRAGLKRFTIDRHHGPFRMILSATK